MATKKKKKAARVPLTWRGFVAVGCFALMGLGLGAALTTLLPEGALFGADRARFQLRFDSAEGLREASNIADGSDVDLNGIGALARLLLWLEHGGTDNERITAQNLLQKASASARTSAEGLYARALLSAVPALLSPVVDARIDDDLKLAPTSALTLLARAVREPDVAKKKILVEESALGRDPILHCTHQLARAALAAGDVPSARAALDRLFRLSPTHAAGAITAAVVAIMEDASTSAPKKAARNKNEGAPRPGQGDENISVDEARLVDLLDDGVGELDEDQLVITLLALRLTRNGDVDKDLLLRAMKSAEHSNHNAQKLLDIFVCAGDVDAADVVIKTLQSAYSLDLAVNVARAHFLRSIPEEERRAAQNRPRQISARGLQLPLGTLAFSFSHQGTGKSSGDVVNVVDLGIPWIPIPDAEFFPEKRVRQLVASIEGGGTRDNFEIRLSVIEKLGLAERASARGDLATALTLLQQAREQVGADAEVALVDSALRARQNDVAGVKAALDAAVSAAPQDPRVLLLTARRYLEIENFAGAKKSLAAFQKLGLRSSAAAALEATMSARSGDLAGARAFLADAKKWGGDDEVLTLRASVLVHRLIDAAEARRAADRLLTLKDNGGSDLVSAWIAEAAYRKGDQPRAEGALKAIVEAKPWIGDAQLFYAQSIAFDPSRKTEAFAAALRALEKLERGPLVDEAKRIALLLKTR